MKDSLNLTGHIVVSQPKCRDSFFSKGVIMVVDHKPNGAWGLMVNKPTRSLTLDTVMQAVGIESKKQDKIFVGGPVESHRVNIIHSLDWCAANTIKIGNDFGITNNLSVLAAIQEGTGPALFRACLGAAVWSAGQLEAEYEGQSPWRQEDRWLDAPATLESVFNLNSDEQWERCIEIVAKNKVSAWL
jgi:putative transcriptional regulator